MADYVLTVRLIEILPETGDIAVELSSYLRDSVGEPFLDSSLTLDQFIVRATKSILPGSGYTSFLEGLAQAAITEKYTFTKSGDTSDGSTSITDLNNAVELKVKMAVTGPGVPSSTTVVAILGDSSVKLSNPVTRVFTANTVATDIVEAGDTTLDDSTVTSLVTSSLENGMAVSGDGIPDGTTIISVIDSSSVELSQNALTSASGVTLTFNPAVDSDSLQNVSPAILTDSFVGMAVTGAGIPDDTVITEVIDSSTATISNRATSSGTGVSMTFSGVVEFVFDPSSWVVDYVDLVRVNSIVKFGLL